MVRQTKPLSGGGKDKFLRGLVETVGGVAPAVQNALVETLTGAIAEVRVRREAYDRVRDRPVDLTSEQAPVAPRDVPARDPPPPPVAAPSTFDPFAFSVVAMLTKKGQPALLGALAKVDNTDDLRRLAEAQHLALDPDLTAIDDIRAAIVVGAERRIAERKAAAS